jgi:hypothetical protein
MKLEQLVRSVLERAIEDGLVTPMELWDDPDPQSRSDAELAGCVGLLRERLSEFTVKPKSPHWVASSMHPAP